ncbi:3'(2'),5'-bisphosphate nucleotidase CysQ [Corynebacterium sphenisci]|uniref:3'(2'),5'-bisphosphate nucleotidase CysQ n=1 Tax=Corynebacterium sphenisci TaxID=191493 RepID=UPI0026DF77A2|nr:3'(2'),5'-bisphosphate nucleotidase CysQ [Corynebacterium sphenisci]MDO5730752.1 3'(2'),5'-bisphosphate nucleotidase CysQ [Corynebacterium sphenisci]
MSAYVDDAILALRLAQGTSEILKGVRNVGLLRGRVLGDSGDALAQEWIGKVLEQHRPDDAMLSEEASDRLERLDCDRVWIIDPLDGTREFAGGRQDWAVHIALVEDHQPVHAAVGLPDLGRVFHTGEAKAVLGPMSGRIVVSRTRPPALAGFVAERLGREVAQMGSAGAKAMHVLLGDYDAYIHSGGQYEWDSAAPVGVCRAAGLHVSRLDGSAHSYNNTDPFLPDTLICRPEIADDILAAIADWREAHPGD